MASVIVAVGVFLLLRSTTPFFKTQGLFFILLIAVIVSAWKGGIGPALLATAGSALVGSWLLAPIHSIFIASGEDVMRLILFVIVALLVSSMHSARSLAERRVREMEHRLIFSLESSRVGCWDADMKKKTFWRSPNIPEIFGYSPEDFATTYEGFFAYVHPADRDFFRLATVRPGSSSTDYEIKHRIICQDGSVRHVTTRGRIYLDKNGNLMRMVGTVFHADPSDKPGDLSA